MSYELFRTDVLTQLNGILQPRMLEQVLNVLDQASQQYEIKRKEVALTVYTAIPEPVKMYLAAKATENLAKGTLRNYLYLLKDFFGTVSKPIEQITTNDVRLYLFNYRNKKNVLDRTLEQKRVYLKCFFDWCVDNLDDKITKNPVNKISTIRFHEKKMEPATLAELERIRFACNTIREKALIDVLYSTGCRVSELCQLQTNDICWDTRTVHIIHGKNDKERVTYLNAEAMISLQAYLNSRKDISPYLFAPIKRVANGKIGKRAVEVEVHNIVERAGITKNITPHTFRRTLATTLLRNGCPVEHIQKILGHAKLSTTMIYAKIDDDDVRRNHERYAI